MFQNNIPIYDCTIKFSIKECTLNFLEFACYIRDYKGYPACCIKGLWMISSSISTPALAEIRFIPKLPPVHPQ